MSCPINWRAGIAVVSVFILVRLAAGCASPGAMTAGGVVEPAQADNPQVTIDTSAGTMTVELWPHAAPATVSNFLAYVDAQFYDGTVFHRVINGFMIQGGGFQPDFLQKPTRQTVRNEAAFDYPTRRRTLAMARTADPHSATCQFFVNLVDNPQLDHRDKTREGFGYCVFGQVVAGFDVAETIAREPAGNHGPHQNVPARTILIRQVRRITP
mgnify:CR=1 FL=1